MKHLIFAAAGVALISGCSGGGSGVEAPEQLRGTWSSDCTNPFVRIEEDKIHVYPDKQTYALKSAALNGSDFAVSYDTPQGTISEVYAVEGETLRLARGNYGGQEATWNKQPMRKCG